MKARISFGIPAMFGLLLAPVPVRAQSVEWTEREVSGPSARNQHRMAYDSSRGVVVLFGGSPDGSGNNGETWEWNGTTWTQRNVSGPSPRASHAMAYDAARGVTVLFGGYFLNHETWEWNGIAWTLRSVGGPSGRYFHAMAYDAARHVTVLFGGFTDSGRSAETWEWNGTAWTQRNVSGPSARSSHAMAYDAARGVTVLFGGYTDSGHSAETWEWNGTTWTQRNVSGPSARTSHGMAYDGNRAVTALFGGYNGSTTNAETWEWNGAAWTQQPVSGPSSRGSHALAYDAARRVTVGFGGGSVGGVYHGETWELGGTQCDSADCSCPPHSPQCALDAYDPVQGLVMRLPWRASAAGQPFLISQGYCPDGDDSEHDGFEVDFAMPIGTPVVAIADGRVIQVGGTNGSTTQCPAAPGPCPNQNGIFVRIVTPQPFAMRWPPR